MRVDKMSMVTRIEAPWIITLSGRPWGSRRSRRPGAAKDTPNASGRETDFLDASAVRDLSLE